MRDVNHKSRLVARLLGMALLVMASAAAQAESAQQAREREGAYLHDRQVCLSGQSQQDQATCLREAGAARQQNLVAQNLLSADELAANAVQRCNAFTGDARQSCLARIRGQGSVSGSVEGGGILRELTEPVK